MGKVLARLRPAALTAVQLAATALASQMGYGAGTGGVADLIRAPLQKVPAASSIDCNGFARRGDSDIPAVGGLHDQGSCRSANRQSAYTRWASSLGAGHHNVRCRLRRLVAMWSTC
ncbi:MAG: hypothetical protein QXU75_03110 [Candidatus Methanomethylicaceae archaeon]